MKKLILDGHKLMYHMGRLNDFLKGKRIAPIHIDMGLTKDCNIRCIYCYGKVQKMDRSQIPRKALLRFMRDAARSGVKSVAMIGDGEPLLNEAVYDAVDEGYKAGLDLSLGTNGILLDKSKALNMLRKLKYIRFNISAADAKSYAFVHKCSPKFFKKEVDNIKKCVELKKKNKLKVTIGMQMVLIPEDLDQVLPLARLGRKLGVDYFVIKHCSDSEMGELKVPLEKYPEYGPLLKKAEKYSTSNYSVIVKWKKILSLGKKNYDRCLGIPFLLQISGNGDVKPCGFLFPKKGYLMGNIINQRFTDIVKSKKYWDIIKYMAEKFDVHTKCGTACRQDYINEFLWNLIKNKPEHINFI